MELFKADVVVCYAPSFWERVEVFFEYLSPPENHEYASYYDNWVDELHQAAIRKCTEDKEEEFAEHEVCYMFCVRWEAVEKNKSKHKGYSMDIIEKTVNKILKTEGKLLDKGLIDAAKYFGCPVTDLGIKSKVEGTKFINIICGPAPDRVDFAKVEVTINRINTQVVLTPLT